MNVGIVAPSPVPFVIGGAERLFSGLADAINTETPHLAELIKLPSREHTLPDLMATYESFTELDLGHFDLVISSKYPSWMVSPPNHVVYMTHPLRGLYDTYQAWGRPEAVEAFGEPALARLAELASASSTPPAQLFDAFAAALQRVGPEHPAMEFPGPLARALVHRLDRYALDPRHVRRHLAISRTVARRPGYFPPSVDVSVAIPPTSLSGFHCDGFTDFFTASRLDGPKRIDLLIEGMRHVPGTTRLLIAGSGPARPALTALAADDPRIVFLGFVPDAELVDRYASALAVPFVPVDEDLGLITLEAQLSGKPVITCTDSGGVAELVEHGVSGWVVEPSSHAVGEAMARLAADPELARGMGDAGRRAAQQHSWGRVIDLVLADDGAARPAVPAATKVSAPARWPSSRTRPRAVVLSNYPIEPAMGGGPLRCKWLLSQLAVDVDVEVIALDGSATLSRRAELGPGLAQTAIPRSARHRAYEGRLGAASAIPISDIADALYAAETVELVAAAAQAARRADVVVLAQPYLAPIADLVAPDLPLVYDSHNAEYHLKSQILRAGRFDAELSETVRSVEADAVRSADLITYCSVDDRPFLEALGPTLADWLLVPNGTDALGMPFVTGTERTRARRAWLDRVVSSWPIEGVERVALFVASDHPPNNEAAEWIARTAGDLPDVLFVNVGSHCRHLQHWSLPPNMILAGIAPMADLRRYLAMADVALNPVMSGGGTNLKLLEAFAAGAPVVATPLGIRGIGVEDRSELLVASLDALPDAIRHTFDDPEREDRVRRARRLVETSFDWRVLGPRFRAGVGQVIGEAPVQRGRPGNPTPRRPLGCARPDER